MPDERPSWERYSLLLASVAALRSEDPYVKVGACLLRNDNSIASLGYNGAPPGVDINWEDRDDRRKRVIHAEVNALRYVNPGECHLLACTHLPCNDCLKMIASYGVKKIVYDEVYQRDYSSLDLSKEFNIELINIIRL
ncbi:deoxycytidylate deaminase [bacterium]|nr:deoxycytidylate deaminase [bacterium]|tara:strand:+ start:155 stop:568 length:414 start_codon:yes stop_codon:yes gene_type:complete